MITLGRKEITEEQLGALIESFQSFKAESDDAIISDDSAFVQTPAFEKLKFQHQNRSNTILLGRKGDGKTAIIRRLEYEILSSNNKNEIFYSINMQDTYFSELISQFSNICTSIKKSEKNIPNTHIAARIWMKYIQISAMQMYTSHVIQQIDENSDKDQSSNSKIFNYQVSIARELGVQLQNLRPNDISTNFLSYIKQKLGEIVIASDTALARGIEYDQRSKMRPVDALRDLPTHLESIAAHISASGLKMTVALDKFDDFIDNLVSNRIDDTRKIRRDFLHGLVVAVSTLDRNKSYDWLRVVASLPQDLVVDMNLREIASHRKTTFVEIKWSINDLKKLIDARIENIVKNSSLKDFFPRQIPNSNSKIQIKEPCDEYIIRHTTRRPREVMAQMCAIFESVHSKVYKNDVKAICKIVSSTNVNIVNDHIVAEWKSVLPNIGVLLGSLARISPKTVFTFDDFKEWDRWSSSVIKDIPGTMSLGPDARALIALSTMFHVGLVGFRIRRGTPKKGYLHQGERDYIKYVFSYSSNFDPISDVVEFLVSPDMPSRAQNDDAKRIQALLLGEDGGIYEISLCISPVFLERVGADHDVAYVIDHLDGLEEA